MQLATRMVVGSNLKMATHHLYCFLITGFSSWDSESSGCDLSAELLAVANETPVGVAGANGKYN